MTLQECAHPLQYAIMSAHLADAGLAVQLKMPPECAHPLQYAATYNHLADDELLAQQTKHRVLAFKSNENREEEEHHWSGVFRLIEIECIENRPGYELPVNDMGAWV
jgi:hypothetical protein